MCRTDLVAVVTIHDPSDAFGTLRVGSAAPPTTRFPEPSWIIVTAGLRKRRSATPHVAASTTDRDDLLTPAHQLQNRAARPRDVLPPCPRFCQLHAHVIPHPPLPWKARTQSEHFRGTRKSEEDPNHEACDQRCRVVPQDDRSPCHDEEEADGKRQLRSPKVTHLSEPVRGSSREEQRAQRRVAGNWEDLFGPQCGDQSRIDSWISRTTVARRRMPARISSTKSPTRNPSTTNADSTYQRGVDSVSGVLPLMTTPGPLQNSQSAPTKAIAAITMTRRVALSGGSLPETCASTATIRGVGKRRLTCERTVPLTPAFHVLVLPRPSPSPPPPPFTPPPSHSLAHHLSLPNVPRISCRTAFQQRATFYHRARGSGSCMRMLGRPNCAENGCHFSTAIARPRCRRIESAGRLESDAQELLKCRLVSFVEQPVHDSRCIDDAQPTGESDGTIFGIIRERRENQPAVVNDPNS